MNIITCKYSCSLHSVMYEHKVTYAVHGISQALSLSSILVYPWFLCILVQPIIVQMKLVIHYQLQSRKKKTLPHQGESEEVWTNTAVIDLCTTEDACPWRSNISKDSSSLHCCRPATIDFQSSIPAEVLLWACRLESDKETLGWLPERDSQEVSCISNFFVCTASSRH